MRHQAKDNSDALAAFIAKKTEIDAMLARLKTLSDDHFEVDPQTLHWGHVGDLEFYAQQLQRISDAVFSRSKAHEMTTAQVELFNYGVGIHGRPIVCIFVEGDYYLYGVTENGYPRVLPSLAAARTMAASALR